jgi:DUF4097 and DUF4098 domain-containing protein YvlB
MPPVEGALPMKSPRPILTLALALFLLSSLAAFADTEKFHKAVPLAPGGTVVLHNFSGAVRIVGAEVSEVTIDAARTAPRDRLDHIKLDVQVNGATVTIEANKKDSSWTGQHDNVVETEFDVQLPKNTRLELDVFSSSVNVRNVSGEQSIKTFSGDVTVEDAAARMKAKTFSGGVDLRLAASATAPDVDVETFSGSIGLKVPETAKAALTFDSFSGQLRSDLPLTLNEQRKGRLRAALNGGDPQHQVQLKTFSGDVKIGK